MNGGATRSPTEERFPSGTGQLRSHCPRPSPQAHTSPPPTSSPPHYTAHQPLQGPGGLSGEQFSFGPGSQQPLAHEHTLALWTELTSHLAALCAHCVPAPSVAGTLLTGLLVWGSLLPYSSLWLPIKGPGRAPLALKGAQAPFVLTCPLHCTGSSSRCGQDAPNQPMSHQVQLTPSFLASPPCLVPALGWTVPLGHRKEGRRDLSPPPHLLSL